MTSSNDILVVTCAAGRQCKFLLPRLYGRYKLRLVVNSISSYDRLRKEYPDAEVVQADMMEPSACRTVLKDASRVFLIVPSLHPREMEMGINMIEAAANEKQRAGNFKHFVFASAMNAQCRRMPNHDRKRYIEEYLLESDLNYTVLNPGDFLNMAFDINRIRAMDPPGYPSLIGLESKSAFVVLEDFAEACEKVIDEGEKHYQAQYQMASMKPIAWGEVARDVGKALEKDDFFVTEMPFQDAVNVLLRGAFGSHETCTSQERDGVEALIVFYRRRGIEGNPNTMEWLLGRKPTSHTEWIARQLQK